MKYAKEAGCKTVNEINMMIWQGAIAFKIWFGVDMPQDYVRQELFEKIKYILVFIKLFGGKNVKRVFISTFNSNVYKALWNL